MTFSVDIAIVFFFFALADIAKLSCFPVGGLYYDNSIVISLQQNRHPRRERERKVFRPLFSLLQQVREPSVSEKSLSHFVLSVDKKTKVFSKQSFGFGQIRAVAVCPSLEQVRRSQSSKSVVPIIIIN